MNKTAIWKSIDVNKSYKAATLKDGLYYRPSWYHVAYLITADLKLVTTTTNYLKNIIMGNELEQFSKYMILALRPRMGTDLCSTLGDDERDRSCILGNINNWSTEWVHFVVLNTDVKVFLNQLSY